MWQIQSASFLKPWASNNPYYLSMCDQNCKQEVIDGKLQCKCGESISIFDWIWANPQAVNIRLSEDFKEVLFHPGYSAGTALIKGETAFKQNYCYYWEVKVLSRLYGTDIMIGVGTSAVNHQEYATEFASLLGLTKDSWGLSYRGYLQHEDLRRKYGEQFGFGSIIGVYLNMFNGTLEYFLNRRSMGVAFTGLKDKELYPMITSTAAKSSIKLICSISKDMSLQTLTLKTIMSNPELYRKYRSTPGMTRIFSKEYFWLCPKEEKYSMTQLQDDLTLSLVKPRYNLGCCGKRRRLDSSDESSSLELGGIADWSIYDDIESSESSSSHSSPSKSNDHTDPEDVFVEYECHSDTDVEDDVRW